MEEFIIYVDVTYDGVPFYVGHGSMSRFNQPKRGKKHDRVGEKYGQIRLTLFKTNDLFESLFMETHWIRELHTFNRNPLAHRFASNFTLGDEGTRGYKYTQEQRLARSEQIRGRKHSEATKAKLSEKTTKSLMGKPSRARGTKRSHEQLFIQSKISSRVNNRRWAMYRIAKGYSKPEDYIYVNDVITKESVLRENQ